MPLSVMVRVVSLRNLSTVDDILILLRPVIQLLILSATQSTFLPY